MGPSSLGRTHVVCVASSGFAGLHGFLELASSSGVPANRLDSSLLPTLLQSNGPIYGEISAFAVGLA